MPSSELESHFWDSSDPLSLLKLDFWCSGIEQRPSTTRLGTFDARLRSLRDEAMTATPFDLAAACRLLSKLDDPSAMTAVVEGRPLVFTPESDAGDMSVLTDAATFAKDGLGISGDTCVVAMVEKEKRRKRSRSWNIQPEGNADDDGCTNRTKNESRQRSRKKKKMCQTRPESQSGLVIKSTNRSDRIYLEYIKNQRAASIDTREQRTFRVLVIIVVTS